MFPGCLTALVTPFRNGTIDAKALADLVEAQIAGGVQGLVPCGSTGESATMSHDEHLEVIRTVVRVARGRVPVVAGTGSNATAEAIRLTKGAEEAGATAALLISPYYNKPTQDGIVAHYAAVAETTRIPLVVYNIQGRTASNILPETMARLARIPRVVGLKEASGSMAQAVETIAACGPDFAVWCGDDAVTLPLMAAGGVGVISVASNVAPERMVALTDAVRAGDLYDARRAHAWLMPLFRALTLEVNPIPVKTALAVMGVMTDELRLPLTPMAAKNRAILEATLGELRLV
jgi:4-hydroxy-tetrahydrodipicolinate synthase